MTTENGARLKGKTALVTGGGTGIGKAIVLWMLEEGASAAIFRSQEDSVSRSINDFKTAGYDVMVLKADVASYSEVSTAVALVLKKLKKIDILVNVAGGSIPEEAVPFWTSKEATWRKIIDINLFGVINTCKAVVDSMIARKYGRIINISSVTGIKPNRGLSDYTSAKAGVYGFTKALALEVAGFGIRVNCISPGFTATERILNRYSKERLEEFSKITPIGRPGRPEEIASMAALLASDECDFMTGSNIIIDGGQMLQ